jgi:ubiquinone/menaquinone biosynthesis C-methylase UbiE
MLVLGRPLPRMLERVAQEVHGASDVLEVAAGTGLVTVTIARSAVRVLATDYSPAMVEQLKRRLATDGVRNVTPRVADIYALDLPASSFDAVVCANVLHLVPDLETALFALKRVLRPGGKLVAPTYAHDQTLASALLSRILGTLARFPGKRRFTVESLAAALGRAGFEVAASEVIPGLVPIAFVSAACR